MSESTQSRPVDGDGRRPRTLLETPWVDFFLGTRPKGIVVEEKNAAEFLKALKAEIGAENDLVKSRMTWNLTFQGLLFTAYSFSGAGDLRDVLPFAGGIAALGALVGAVAAFAQINVLKRQWYLSYEQLQPYGPRPFSGWLGDLAGRFPSLAINSVLLIIWGYLGR